MQNAHKKDWHPDYCSPMGMGTRCHNLAMYVIFESPFQMLCDSPSNYMKEPECMDFLSQVPTVWKNTIPLEAKVGEYVVVAREAEDGTWYLGAMAGESAHSFDIKLDFLTEGKYQVEVWRDGANAAKHAEDFARKTLVVSNEDNLEVRMCHEGGYVAIFKPVK